jgi:hypothetical protein
VHVPSLAMPKADSKKAARITAAPMYAEEGRGKGGERQRKEGGEWVMERDKVKGREESRCKNQSRERRLK